MVPPLPPEATEPTAEVPASTRPAGVYVALTLGLLSFSMSAILVRLAGEAPGLAVAVWRTLFAAGLLLPVAVPLASREIGRFTARDLLLVSGAGVLLGLHFVLYIESLYHTSVASASVLVTTSPIFLAVFGVLFLGEVPSRRVVAAIVTAMAGAILIGVGDASAGADAAPRALLGNALALTAALLFSFYLLIGRVVRRKTSWLAYVAPLYAMAAVTIFALATVRQTPLMGYPATVYLLCGAMALGPQLLGHGSYNYAVKYFPAAALGLFSLLEPVGASFLAYLLFGEVPRVPALAGMALVLGSVSFALLPARRTAARVRRSAGGSGASEAP